MPTSLLRGYPAHPVKEGKLQWEDLPGYRELRTTWSEKVNSMKLGNSDDLRVLWMCLGVAKSLFFSLG